MTDWGLELAEPSAAGTRWIPPPLGRLLRSSTTSTAVPQVSSPQHREGVYDLLEYVNGYFGVSVVKLGKVLISLSRVAPSTPGREGEMHNERPLKLKLAVSSMDVLALQEIMSSRCTLAP